jgi:hypothetical protein
MNQRKGVPKIQLKYFVALKPARCKAQSTSVRTFLGFAIAPLINSFLTKQIQFGFQMASEYFGLK